MGRTLLAVAGLALIAASADAAGALERDLSTDLKTRPIMKVVRMLEDMQQELTKEMEDDKAVRELFDCWCKTNEQEKVEAIAAGEQKAAELEASLSAAAARIKELKEKLKATKDEYNKDWDALKDAKAMRMKEGQEFHGEEMDLITAIKAAKQAIVVLSKHHPSLSQVREVARLLQTAKVSQLVLSKGVVGAEVLQGFLQQASRAASFMAIPGFQSYAPQSGQIFGILKQMKETFEKDLAEAQGDEAKAKEQFELLKAAKEDEMAAGKKQIAEYDAEIAALGEKAAQEAKELEEVEEQLGWDKEFLANLKKKCAANEEEFDARMKMRLAELAAVEDTIKFLNSDEAFAVFDKTVNSALLQVASSGHLVRAASSDRTAEEATLRKQAVAVLQRIAKHVDKPKLALLLVSAQLDAFTKVKELIDKMVAELSQQQKDEIAHRDWCIDELNANNRSTAAATDKKELLEAKIEDLKKSIEKMTKDIETHTATIAETQKQMGRASDTREAENVDYQQTIVDQRLTQAILKKALDRMKQVYYLLQQPGAPHIQTSATKTDPGNGPARFTKYEKNAGGNKVVALIEAVIADSVETEATAIADEQDSQTAYENFMKDSNESIIMLTKAINTLKSARADAKADLSMAETDLETTIKELEDLAATAVDLHGSCDYILKNFDARQAARAAEIDALKEAKNILSGMK